MKKGLMLLTVVGVSLMGSLVEAANYGSAQKAGQTMARDFVNAKNKWDVLFEAIKAKEVTKGEIQDLINEAKPAVKRASDVKDQIAADLAANAYTKDAVTTNKLLYDDFAKVVDILSKNVANAQTGITKYQQKEQEIKLEDYMYGN